MAQPAVPPGEPYYVDTPRGIFTASGTWFHTTEEALEDFAASVLKHEGIESLVRRADVWIRSPRTLALWVFIVALAALPTWVACGVGLGAFVAWKLLAPSLGGAGLGRLLRVLEAVPLQFAAYVIVLSLLALWPDAAGVVASLVGFVVLRWKLLDAAVDPLARPVLDRLYPLPIADQTLRAVVVKSALRHKVSTPELDRMEARVVELSKPIKRRASRGKPEPPEREP